MEDLRLCESEYRFMQLIWERGPLSSGSLAALAHERLGWKKSTAYTVLKKLCERGFAANEGAVVRALVARERVDALASERLVERNFGGSLPLFLAAFLGGGKRLSQAEAEELKALIDAHRD